MAEQRSLNASNHQSLLPRAESMNMAEQRSLNASHHQSLLPREESMNMAEQRSLLPNAEGMNTRTQQSLLPRAESMNMPEQRTLLRHDEGMKATNSQPLLRREENTVLDDYEYLVDDDNHSVHSLPHSGSSSSGNSKPSTTSWILCCDHLLLQWNNSLVFSALTSLPLCLHKSSTMSRLNGFHYGNVCIISFANMTFQNSGLLHWGD